MGGSDGILGPAEDAWNENCMEMQAGPSEAASNQAEPETGPQHSLLLPLNQEVDCYGALGGPKKGGPNPFSRPSRNA